MNIKSIFSTLWVLKFSSVILLALEKAKKPLSEVGFTFSLTTISSSALLKLYETFLVEYFELDPVS